MPLIQLLEVLIVVGVLLWLVNRFIPMQGQIKSILNGVVVIAVVLWLLNIFGLFIRCPTSTWAAKRQKKQRRVWAETQQKDRYTYSYTHIKEIV